MMIRKSNLLILLPLAASLATAMETADTPKGMTISDNNLTLQLSCLNEGIVHVQAYPTRSKAPESMVVDDQDFSFTGFTRKHDGNQASLETPKLIVRYDASSQSLSFIDKKTGETLLKDTARDFQPAEVPGDKGFAITQTFTLSPDEGIYGLGQYQEGIREEGVFNYRGKTVNMVQANCDIVNPVLVSTRNYAVFWDNYSKTTFTDNEQGARFSSEMGDGASYYFIYTDNMVDTGRKLRELTGQAPMFPKTAFGFWLSKERYKSFDELTGAVAEYRKRGIPLDNIVQDWQYWGTDKNYWNNMAFEPKNFPNPEKAIADLHDKYNVRLTVSVWPSVGKKTEIYNAMEAANALSDVPTWAGYKVVDIYNPKAREIFWNKLYKGLYTKGIDCWWMDGSEPAFHNDIKQDDQEKRIKDSGMTSIGSYYRYLNTYSLPLTKMMYDNLRKQNNKRVSILTRSAFTGQQKYATSIWSGDVDGTWNVFKAQIPAGLNIGMAGIPYWTTDIGGFRPQVMGTDIGRAGGGGYKNALKNPAYLELYTRWFQFGVFCPLFRAHGTQIPREIWRFGEPGTPWYDIQADMIKLRYSLLSYIYSNSWLVTSQGTTMMRPMVMDFTGDKAVRDRADGFIFGESLLVYPVTRPMFHDRKGPIEQPDTNVPVYLPLHDGQYWYDFHSGRRYKAGQTISYAAPLDTIPVFVKGGSIVPRDKPVQHVGEDKGDVMDLVVYPGKDAEFILYEDDGETYDYEKGQYSGVTVKWNDKNETVSLSPYGKGKPRLNKRTFHVKVIRSLDAGKTHTEEKKTTYENKPLSVSF